MAEEDINDPIGGNVGQTAGVGSSLSEYVGEYGTDMLGEGWAASDLPYEAYTGPLTAGESDLQTKAFEGLAGLTIPTEGMTSFTGSMADPSSVAGYMNPYLQNVLNPQIANLKREADIARVADASRLTKAGSYGGSRQAVLDALTNENLLRQLDKGQKVNLGEGFLPQSEVFDPEKFIGQGINPDFLYLDISPYNQGIQNTLESKDPE